MDNKFIYIPNADNEINPVNYIYWLKVWILTVFNQPINKGL